MADYTCCGMMFDSEEAYLTHREQVHGETRRVRHTCCGMNFYSDAAYFEHRATVHGEERQP